MNDLDTIIAKYLDNSCSEEESAELQKWLQDSSENALHFEKIKAVWQMSVLDAEAFEPNLEKAWNQVNQQTIKEPVHKTKVLSINPRWWRYAAAILVTGLIGWGGFSLFKSSNLSDAKQIVVQTKLEKNTVVDLPDGSQVWLSANSTLRYPEEFSKDARSVELQGVAYFEVLKNSENPFSVKTEETITTVVGTAFNVRALAEDSLVAVTVTSGKVHFGSQQDQPARVSLNPGDQGTYYKENLLVEKSTSQDLNFLAWKTGKLIFKNTPLPEVITAINRHYQSNVVLGNPALNTCQITSTFDNKSLDEILDVLTVIFNGKVTYQQDAISISGSGCL